MPEDEEMILPEGFEETPSEETTAEEEFTEEVTTEAEDTKPATEQTEPTVQEPQKVKIKFNHEEREIPLEEAAVLAQKGLNYEKAVERAAQEARDSVIAGLGYTWNGAPITTEAEYKQAMAEQEIIDKYQGQVPDELMDEILEGRRDREERKAEKAKQEAERQREAMVAEWAEAFPDAKIESVKEETWLKVKGGLPLKYAYMEQERGELLTKVKVQEQNGKNKQRAPVTGVTAHGTGEVGSDPFLDGFNSID